MGWSYGLTISRLSVMGWSLVVSRRRAVLLQILWSIMREREQHVVSRSLIQQNIAGAHAFAAGPDAARSVEVMMGASIWLRNVERSIALPQIPR